MVKDNLNIVVRNVEDVPVEVLATAIRDISEGIKKLRAGPLNEKALILLIQFAAPGNLTQREIKDTLNGIEGLAATYLKKKP